MGKLRSLSAVLLLTVFSGVKANAQVSDIPPVLMEIQKQLLSQSTISYDYKVEQTLPDGKKNSLIGKMVKTKNYMQETNSGELVLQTDQWYYKADLIHKKIFIINAEKINRMMKLKGQSPSMMSMIPDSVLQQHGKIGVKQVGDVVKVTIEFGPQALIKQIYLEYDNLKKQPLVYKVTMDVLYSIDGGNYEERYMSQTMSATNFSFKTGQKPIIAADYFTVSGGKIKLKKYTDYKIIEHL